MIPFFKGVLAPPVLLEEVTAAAVGGLLDGRPAGTRELTPDDLCGYTKETDDKW